MGREKFEGGKELINYKLIKTTNTNTVLLKTFEKMLLFNHILIALNRKTGRTVKKRLRYYQYNKRKKAIKRLECPINYNNCNVIYNH